jgi:hypothetical protein
MIRQVDLAWAALGVVETRRERLHPERAPGDRVNKIAPSGSKREMASAPGKAHAPALRVVPVGARGG